jgi:hypothetical protein
MSRSHVVTLGCTALAIVALAAMTPAKHSAGPGCDGSPSAATFLARSRAEFGKLDSAGSARLGWKSPPKNMSLVTRAATCDAISTAHNAYVTRVKSANLKVTRASIAVEADGTYLLDVAPSTPGSEHVTFVYDTAYRFRVVY